MYNDVARRFIAELTTVKYIPTGVSTITTPITLMSEPISMYIDSTIPFIYLPTSICSKFESEFGLQWDASNEIYTVNNTQHTALQNMNPNITLTVANDAGQDLDIILPYAAFDLTATFPVLSNLSNITDSVAYFPLKRADNDTQYTLGRVFLQET
jgi:PKD repeat protein